MFKKYIFTSPILSLFVAALIVRIAFYLFSGIQYSQGPDFSRYDQLSDQILIGNYNLLVGAGDFEAYIIAPIYPYLMALFKYLFSSEYVFYLSCFQILLSSLSVPIIFLISIQLTNSKVISLLASFAYIFFPLTLFYTHQFSQESIFQSFFIFTIYFFNRFIFSSSYKDLTIFSIFFGITCQIKSHILLIIPFLSLGYLAIKKFSLPSIMRITFCAILVNLMLLPYGAFNLIKNDSYVLSTSGQGSHFLIGHNDDFYRWQVETPPLNSEEFNKLKSMDFEIFTSAGALGKGLTHNQKQVLYFDLGLKWIEENQRKFVTSSLRSLQNFIFPGVSKNHYSFNAWMIILVISLPIYLLSYFGIYHSIRHFHSRHISIIAIFFGLLIYAVVYYNQNRFRTITIEPFYLIYSAIGLVALINNYCPSVKKKLELFGE